MHIREATHEDRTAIHAVYASAFPESERAIVAKLAVDLLAEQVTPPVLSLVAEMGEVGEIGADMGATTGNSVIRDSVIGHVAFSPIKIDSAPNRASSADGAANMQGYILAPLAVSPAAQKQGVGTRLVETGIQQLKDSGATFLLVYGDPDYYGRFGFTVQEGQRYTPPYKLQYPHGWQGLALRDRGAGDAPIKITCVPPICDPALW